MTDDALRRMVNFWKNVYSSSNPFEEIRKADGPIPHDMAVTLGQMSTVYPEPYYGYLDGDTTNDALLMFINPGEIDNVNRIEKLNSFIQDRFINWTTEDYLAECSRKSDIHSKECTCKLRDVAPTSCRWRRERWRSLENIVGHKISFMHTMEFFPYHSKKWAELAGFKEWIFTRHTTKLAIDAIVSMAVNKHLKYIVGIGMPWYEIFSRYGYEPNESITIKLPGRTRYTHKFFKYMFSPDATPVIISVMGGGFIRLPRNQEVVSAMKNLMC